VLVELEGADVDHAVADHLGADGAEVRAGDLPGGDVVADRGRLAGRQRGPAGEQAGATSALPDIAARALRKPRRE
jgi:hypothetical protein